MSLISNLTYNNSYLPTLIVHCMFQHEEEKTGKGMGLLLDIISMKNDSVYRTFYIIDS